MPDPASVPSATEDVPAGDVISPRLPVDPRKDPALSRLPGMRALSLVDWIVLDEAFGAQMALRDRLIHREGTVIETEGAGPAIVELREVLLRALAGLPGYAVRGTSVRRPDGVTVVADGLASLARLSPLDLCIVERQANAHVLTAGALLFPASWMLSEKIGRPLDAVHAPVAQYDARLASRVDRLFDALHPDRPLWRMNALRYEDAALHQPRSEHARRDRRRPGNWLRCERQSLVKLPRTGAAVFGIQTFVVPWTDPLD